MRVDPIDPRKLGDEPLGKTSIDPSILARLTEGSVDDSPSLSCDESQSGSSAFVSETDDKLDQEMARLEAIQQRQDLSKDMLYGSA
jgi:hypothetical protein